MLQLQNCSCLFRQPSLFQSWTFVIIHLKDLSLQGREIVPPLMWKHHIMRTGLLFVTVVNREAEALQRRDSWRLKTRWKGIYQLNQPKLRCRAWEELAVDRTMNIPVVLLHNTRGDKWKIIL